MSFHIFFSFSNLAGDFSNALIFFFSKETVAFGFINFPYSFSVLRSIDCRSSLNHFLVESKHNNTVLFAAGQSAHYFHIS